MGVWRIGYRREPSTPRITLWRKLRRLGAVQVVDNLVSLPLDALPRAMVAVWGALGACFVIGMFGVLFKLPSRVIDLSPFQHVPAIPAQDFSAQPLIILTAVAPGLVGIGLFGFRRRDVS